MSVDVLIRRFSESHFLALEARRSRRRARRALLVPRDELPRAVQVIAEGLDWNTYDVAGLLPLPMPVGAGARKAMKAAEDAARTRQNAVQHAQGKP